MRGYRKLPRGDVAALARAIAAVSRLALIEGQPVAEAEINPLMVRADGVLAVDGLVVLKEISNNPDSVIPSAARNLLFLDGKKQILRPAASE